MEIVYGLTEFFLRFLVRYFLLIVERFVELIQIHVEHFHLKIHMKFAQFLHPTPNLPCEPEDFVMFKLFNMSGNTIRATFE